jgi:rod shape-determining protein MreB
LSIGETTAEQIKIKLGCATPLMTELVMEVRGRNLGTGLPETIQITSSQIGEAMQESVEKIIDIIKQTLEKTPPELASDIMEKGIVLTGGGALIQNFDKLLSEKTQIPVYIAEGPLECVARGAGKTLEDLEKLRTVLSSSRKR